MTRRHEMRDGLPDVLGVLQRYARTFDEIFDEADARYSATSFVKWVQLETRAARNGERSDGLPAQSAKVDREL